MKCFVALLLAMLVVSVRADDKTNQPTAVVSHVDAKAAARLVEEGKVTVLDIRTPAEFNAGHIAGATNIDYRARSFREKIANLDRDKPYLVHCAVGMRSTNSLPQFEKLGFKHIIHLDGGIQAWELAGNKTTK
jgi:rhodanese-related sulfurtransferase